MEYKDYIKQRETYKIADDLYKCPICGSEKSRRGFIQHIWRIHFGMITGGNNGSYHTQEYKDKIIKKNEENIERRLGKILEFEVSCHTCKKTFKVLEREKQFPKKDRYFCCRACANKRDFSKETLDKKLKKRLEFLESTGKGFHRKEVNGHFYRTFNNICKNCQKEFESVRLPLVFCSSDCEKSFRFTQGENNCIGDINKERFRRASYRRACSFRFGLKTYPEKFDFSLVEKFGWYRAKNRGDNLCGVSRDHLYSVMDGYKNGIDPAIISHPANCKLVLQTENSRKGSNSSITFEDLLKRIEDW